MKKSIFLVFTLLVSGILLAQETNTFTFNHLALSVKDVDQSSNFYKNVLNLVEITNRTKLENTCWLSIGEGKELHLISILKQPVIINKAVHLALTTANFDGFIKRLDELKITYSDWPGKINTVNKRADGIDRKSVV